jgi:hypothetical protein
MSNPDNKEQLEKWSSIPAGAMAAHSQTAREWYENLIRVRVQVQRERSK